MNDLTAAELPNGKLPPCPDAPCCVCSEFTGTGHAIPPLPILGDPAEAWAQLLQIVRALKGATILNHTENHLKARVQTAVLRFVDILEFRLDKAGLEIHVRSASRIGYWDLGVNRRRVETIRKLWTSPQ